MSNTRRRINKIKRTKRRAQLGLLTDFVYLLAHLGLADVEAGDIFMGDPSDHTTMVTAYFHSGDPVRYTL